MNRFIRFRTHHGAAWGQVTGNQVFPIENPFAAAAPAGPPLDLQSVELLPPAAPSKILAVGLNYRSHLHGRQAPLAPELFYKPPSALVSTGEPIEIPEQAADVHFEGELVVVIGKTARRVSRDEARAAIFGVTCGNDVSDREWQRGKNKDLQWWRAKGCDTFAPLGPAIVTGLDYANLDLVTRVNGRIAQQGSTADLIHDCLSVVSWASRWVTLVPGDLIYTGTPGDTFALKPGDVVEVEIGGVGVLRNPVA